MVLICSIKCLLYPIVWSRPGCFTTLCNIAIFTGGLRSLSYFKQFLMPTDTINRPVGCAAVGPSGCFWPWMKCKFVASAGFLRWMHTRRRNDFLVAPPLTASSKGRQHNKQHSLSNVRAVPNWDGYHFCIRILNEAIVLGPLLSSHGRSSFGRIVSLSVLKYSSGYFQLHNIIIFVLTFLSSTPARRNQQYAAASKHEDDDDQRGRY